MGKKFRKDKCQVELITDVLRLVKKKVPVMLLWHNKGELSKVGTGNMCKWYNELDADIQKDLQASMVQDIIDMNNGTEELIVNEESLPDKVRASSIFQGLSYDASSLPRLPFPLSIMSKKQKSKYISDRIAQEARSAGVKLVYGAENFRPTFWPEDVWSWSNMRKTLRNMTENDFTGLGTYSMFLEMLVRIILEQENKDPEEFTEAVDRSSLSVKKKERIRGINRVPTIIRRGDPENNVENNIQDGSMVPFKPRRQVGASPFKGSGSKAASTTTVPIVAMNDDLQEEISDNSDPGPAELNVECSRFQELLADSMRLVQFRSLLAEVCRLYPRMTLEQMVGFSGLEESDLAVFVSSVLGMSSSCLQRLNIHFSYMPFIEKMANMMVPTKHSLTNHSTTIPRDTEASAKDIVSRINKEHRSMTRGNRSGILDPPHSTDAPTPGHGADNLDLTLTPGHGPSNLNLDLTPAFDTDDLNLVHTPGHGAGNLNLAHTPAINGAGDLNYAHTQGHAAGKSRGVRKVELITDRLAKQIEHAHPKIKPADKSSKRSNNHCLGINSGNYFPAPPTRTFSKNKKIKPKSQQGINQNMFSTSCPLPPSLPPSNIFVSLNMAEDTPVYTNLVPAVVPYPLPDFQLVAASFNTDLVDKDGLMIRLGSTQNKSREMKDDGRLNSFDVQPIGLDTLGSASSCAPPAVPHASKDKYSASCFTPSKKQKVKIIDTKRRTVKKKIFDEKDNSGNVFECSNPCSISGALDKVMQFKKSMHKKETERGKEGTKKETGKKIFKSKYRKENEKEVRKSKSKKETEREKEICEANYKNETENVNSLKLTSNLKRKDLKARNMSEAKISKLDVKLTEVTAHVVKEMIKDKDDSAVVKAVKCEVYHVISAKSVDEILKLPSKSEERRNNQLDALDLEISESAAKAQLEEEASDASIKLLKERQQATEKRFEENGARRNRLHSELTESQILDIVGREKQFLIGVKSGVNHSWRHQAFNKGGHGRWALNEWVFDSLVREEHRELILDQIDNITDGGDYMQRVLNSDYNWKVLLPEILIKVAVKENYYVINTLLSLKIYKEFFDVGQREAEQRMYETPLSEDCDVL